MTIRVQLFALARQLAGCEVLQLELPPGATVRQLRDALADHSPALASLLPHMMFALNADYASDDTVIPPGADIACIPPVSGG
jgi:molybdopterin synthase catalytic subunit/molybdopterin synthase sulfur carrier subunit